MVCFIHDEQRVGIKLRPRSNHFRLEHRAGGIIGIAQKNETRQQASEQGLEALNGDGKPVKPPGGVGRDGTSLECRRPRIFSVGRTKDQHVVATADKSDCSQPYQFGCTISRKNFVLRDPMMFREGGTEQMRITVGILVQGNLAQRLGHARRGAEWIGADAEIHEAGRLQAEAAQLVQVGTAML